MTIGPVSSSAAALAPARRRPWVVRRPERYWLAGHLVVWAAVACALRSNLDMPGEMLEAYVWGEAWQAGYFKHPPLMAWLAGAWFAVMPRSDASYALLAAATVTVGLAGLHALWCDLLTPCWRAHTAVATLVLPTVTVMALRFNANAVLLAVWPWVARFFLRYMDRGRWRDGLGLAAAAALALLGKYFSAVLLCALLVAACAHPPWRRVLLSPRTAVCAGVGAALLTPHVAWLLRSGFGPVIYAAQATAGWSGHALACAIRFMLSQAALALPAAALLAWCARGSVVRREALLDVLRPRSDPLWWVLVGPVAIAAAMTAVLGARTATVLALAMPPLVALFVAVRLQQHSLASPVERPTGRVLAAVWACAPALAGAAWQVMASHGQHAVADPRAELAEAVEREWQRRYRMPLHWVGGSEAHAAAVAFYGASRATYWSLADTARRSPWVDPRRVDLDGGVLVCTLDDMHCQVRARAWSELSMPLTVNKQARGHVFASVTYLTYWRPPLTICRSPHRPGPGS
ncbi:glycosyltransferase family 39 protein [Rhizobacter sp. AJA081-3]|uniref:glycosyltransferase family 39 protein n=1 Tax=Rhizobacter sp. AJA081-3 TaxID=2753607 RepID=UPI001FD87093|nr:glycosyltransferase family 39 protein [Rhizobacter sp. AJA081-3]